MQEGHPCTQFCSMHILHAQPSSAVCMRSLLSCRPSARSAVGVDAQDGGGSSAPSVAAAFPELPNLGWPATGVAVVVMSTPRKKEGGEEAACAAAHISTAYMAV
jgi:hypothetical protein